MRPYLVSSDCNLCHCMQSKVRLGSIQVCLLKHCSAQLHTLARADVLWPWTTPLLLIFSNITGHQKALMGLLPQHYCKCSQLCLLTGTCVGLIICISWQFIRNASAGDLHTIHVEQSNLETEIMNTGTRLGEGCLAR